MDRNLPKNYDPKTFEERIYGEWEKSGSFKPEAKGGEERFTIMMPPPNITGQLHMGHAMDASLQDVLVRFKRMQGYRTLWLPGTDHASIATEVKVVEKIREEEGKTKEEIGREEFLKRAWAWKETYGNRITMQQRKMGASCDWTRERFTMDEGCNRAVREHFVNLYNKGLIYKGARLINWCPVCKSALSDIEVEHEDVNGKYYYFRYPGEDGSEGITVATSRPETMFGDVAVAVNPEDERYKDIVGKNVVLPLVGRVMPVVADPYPDMTKGTGAVKITPNADPNDFEVGQRQGLGMIEFMDESGRMLDVAGKYAGMDRYECRKAWVRDLEEAGYLVKTEDMTIPTGTCYRCHNAVEPRISEQWFVKMEPLAKPAIEAVRRGDTVFVPDRFDKIYYHWMEDIKDWCISRQLWWGHRIPAYYCEECGETVVSADEPSVCPKCGCTHFRQDEDVLDTWFSSALWPFSTLGWPEETEDLRTFYPTSVLVTGYDIIFFWVARMIFSGVECMGEAPFKYVLIHGLVRDALGRKMSKSLGNGIDPLEVIDVYGADALRFMLLSGIAPGSDIRYQDEKVQAARNFGNKLWNASRFVIMNLYDEDGNLRPAADEKSADLKPEDRWMLQTISDAVKEITANMDRFELALAAAKIYDLIWSNYCDWYIELTKSRLYSENEEDKKTARYVLLRCLKDLLRLLHPFMPFITEEIWGHLPKAEGEASMIILENWPKTIEEDYSDDVRTLEISMGMIKAVRNIRSETGVLPAKKIKAVVIPDADYEEAARKGGSYLKALAGIEDLEFAKSRDELEGDLKSAALPGIEIYIPMDDLVDYEEELAKLVKDRDQLTKNVAAQEGKLGNENFVSRAPANVVQAERDKLANYRDLLEKTLARLAEVEKKVKG